MAQAGARRHVAHAAAEVDQLDPVAGAQRVLGDRRRRPHSGVEAARRRRRRPHCCRCRARCRGAGALGVTLRPGRGDVQGPGPRRDRPVDPPEPVARTERPHLCRLAPRAVTVRAVQADRPARPRDHVDGGEVGAQGERRHCHGPRWRCLRPVGAEPRRARGVADDHLVPPPSHGANRHVDVERRPRSRRHRPRRRDRLDPRTGLHGRGGDVAGSGSAVGGDRDPPPASPGPRTACAPRRRATSRCHGEGDGAHPRRPGRGTERRGPPGRRGRRARPRAGNRGRRPRPAGGRASVATRRQCGRRSSPWPHGRRHRHRQEHFAHDRRAVDISQPQLGSHRDPVREGRHGDRLDVLGNDEVATLRSWRRPWPPAAGERSPRGRADQHLPVASRLCGQLDAVAPDRRVDGDGLAGVLQGEEAAGVEDGLDRLLLTTPVDAPGEDLPLLVRRSGSRTARAAGSGRAGPRAAGRCPRTRPGWRWRRRGTARSAGTSCPRP